MVRASWKGATLAESTETIVVEKNHYFPPADVDMQYLVPTDYRTTCPWKGEAHYYNVLADGEKNVNAAWSYPQPKEKARQIAGYYAFWKDIEIDTID